MGKQRTAKQIVDGAANLVSQVNSLLVSTANPSDDTSLSIRLSMVKVSATVILWWEAAFVVGVSSVYFLGWSCFTDRIF